MTSEVVRVHTAYLGRGPTKSFSFHHANIVISILNQTMTRAERTLAANNEGEAVLNMRRRFQAAMSDELKASVAELTGHGVVAFMSDNHLDPDIAVEVFILGGPIS